MDAGARRPDIDWLRVSAIVLVFLVHVAQVFSPIEDWHIDSPDTSRLLAQFTVFLGPWIMPLFMLLAGASAWFARRRHDDASYLRVRVGRLLVPLVAGTVLLVPPQVYLRRVYRDEFDGTFLEFYPRFFDGVFPEGNFSYGHLWFIAYLFLYMLAGLPLFRALGRPAGRRLVERIAGWLDRPWGVLLPAVPVAVSQLVLRIPFPSTTGALVGDWATHAWLFLVFLYGYLLGAHDGIASVVDRQWRLALPPALALSAGLGVWAWPGAVYERIPGGELTVGYAVFWIAFSLCSWSWLAVFVGASREHLRHEGPFLRWAVPLVYPFYVFHQTVIVIVAFYLVEIPLGVHTRFALVALASFAATLLAMEAARRIPGLRSLFGLAPRKGPGPSATAAKGLASRGTDGPGAPR
jgi:glucans biosynthesis protein C